MKTFKKTLFLSLFFIINFIFIFIFSSGFTSIDMLMSINFILIFLFLIYHIIKQKVNIFFSSYIIFNYLFFFIAPIMQLYGIHQLGGTFPNTMPLNHDLIFLTILSIITFNSIFFTTYIIFRKKIFINLFKKKVVYTDKTFFLLLLLSIIVLVLFMDRIEILVAHQQFNTKLSIMESLIIGKVLFSLPIAYSVYFIVKIKNNYKHTYLIMLILSFILLMIFKNPMLEKRNALGPIYMTLLYFSYPGLFKTNFRTFILLFLSMVVIFPISAILTHNRTNDSIMEILSSSTFNVNSFFEVFSQLHYDAFSNVVAAWDYMFQVGVSYGFQLLGSIFFFVPRAIWIDKPLSGGKEIGSFLTSNYEMWFDNLSMPFVGESIMNFGYFGIIIFPIILAIVVIFFDRLLHSDDLLKRLVAVYFAFHIIFLLRGDLMNGIAYFMGTFIALYFIPKIIYRITKTKRL